jgi:5-formyltetrahydrofolate cyclo-ligase
VEDDPGAQVQSLKRRLRREAQQLRRQQPDKDGLSRVIWDRVMSTDRCAAAASMMVYANLPSEVRTLDYLPALRARGKRIALPFCAGDELHLFAWESLDELSPGAMNILEPRDELRHRPDRRMAIEQIDLVLAPGVAFDRRGGRLGYGKGYYDRLLRRVRPDALVAGLAFECQLVEAIPVTPRDVAMDLVVTEKAIYRGRGR